MHALLQCTTHNELYISISSDSLHHNHRLTFKNDSTLELSAISKHLTSTFTMNFNYRKEGKTIIINRKPLKPTDSLALLNNGFSQFTGTLFLDITDKALLDEKSQLIYVLNKDFKSNNYLIYLIDGRKFKQNIGVVNSYGLLNKKPKTNPVLKRKLKTVTGNMDNYSMNVYKGIDAYKKFGYESVFGVIELQHLKNK